MRTHAAAKWKGERGTGLRRHVECVGTTLRLRAGRYAAMRGGGRALARNRVRTQWRSHSARDGERESDGVLGIGSHGAYYIKNFPRCVVGACRRPAPHLQRSLENARDQSPRKPIFQGFCGPRRTTPAASRPSPFTSSPSRLALLQHHRHQAALHATSRPLFGTSQILQRSSYAGSNVGFLL